MSRTGRLIVFALLALLLGLQILKLAKRAEENRDDIAVYREAAIKMAAGESPYKPGRMTYIYPPLLASLMRPLAHLPPWLFGVAWALVLTSCWIACVALARHLLGRSMEPVSFALDVLPSLIVLRWILSGWGRGQVAMLLLALMLAAFLFERRNRTSLAGLMLAIGGAIKVFPLVAGVMFLRRGRLSGVLAIGVSLVFLQLLSIAQVGLDGYIAMVRDGFIATVLPEIQSQQLYWDNRSPVASVLRWLGVTSAATHSAASVLWTVLCALLMLCLRPPPGDPRENRWRAFVVTCAMAMPPVIWPHYFAILLFPFAVALEGLERTPEDPPMSCSFLIASAVLLNANPPLFTDTLGLSFLEDLPNAGLIVSWCGFLIGLMPKHGSCASARSASCVSA